MIRNIKKRMNFSNHLILNGDDRAHVIIIETVNHFWHCYARNVCSDGLEHTGLIHHQSIACSRHRHMKNRLCVYQLFALVQCRFTYCSRNKMTTISRRHFQKHFLWMETFDYQKNFIEICSFGSNWLCVSIGLDNGLAPNRRQAINWSYDE